MRNRFSLSALPVLALGLSLSLPATSQTYKFNTLYSFNNNGTDPKTPSALIIDGNGNLYGTSISGGSFNNAAVFKFTKGGLSVLYSFNGEDITDAISPINLVQDSKGNLYGDTEALVKSWVGDLFELTPGSNGTYTFSSLYVAPDVPLQIVLNPAGDIFWLNCGYEGSVTCDNNTSLNEISNGQNSVLYYFASTGFYASGNYVMDKSGNIYGTEAGDGGQTSWGLVYKWSPVSGYSVLHMFNGTDGSDPNGLRQDSSGALVGTTGGGGFIGGVYSYGTVFKISSSGSFSTLYNFCSKTNCADGSYPVGALTLDSKGNIFGVLISGVFKLTSSGVESLLHRSASVFMGPGLVMDKAGNLYGTTLNGGSAGLGSVYRLTVSP